MIINQVSDNIGLFYTNVITYFCEAEKIRVVKNSSLEITDSQDLFLDKEIKLFFSNNKNLKTFLGDGGSLFLGFIVATSFVQFAVSNKLYDPSIVLWFAAIPIFDFCAVIVRRKLLKRKITVADRSHIHHLLLSWGFSHFHTTALISTAAVALLLFGVFVTSNHPSLSFWSFLALFLLYLSIRMFADRAE